MKLSEKSKLFTQMNPSKKYAVIFAAIAAISLILELFVFNFKWINSAFSKETGGLQYTSSDITRGSDYITINSDNAEITIPNVNQKIKYLRVSLDKDANQKAEITVSATDEANSRGYLSAPARTVVSGVKQSQYIRLHFSGEVGDLKISICGMNDERVDADFIGVNAHVPLMFSWVRFLIVILLLSLAYILRPKSKVYKYRTDLTRQKQKTAVIIFAAVFAVVFLIMIQWNRTALEFHERYPHHRQYYELCDAFKEGHVSLNLQPSRELDALDNPYDTSQRGGVSFEWDTAYYNGKYYCYFGAVPAALFYLPYNLITGRDLPNYAALYIFGVLTMIGILLLLWEIIKKWYKDTPFAVYLLMSGVFAFISYTVYVVYKPDLYMVPTLSAMMFAVWGLALWLSAERKNKKGETVLSAPRLAAGSAFIALTAGCRPQFLISAVLGVMFFWDYAFKKRELFSKKSMKQTVSVCLPFVIIGVILMAYNFARFGSPFDFGANYNLTTNDMTHRGFVFGRIGLGIFTYFLQPFRMNSIFPFIHDFGSETVYQGLTLTENLMGGTLWLYPILIIGVYGAFKRNLFADKRAYRLVYFSVVMAVVVAVMDAQMAGLLTRYFNDFVWLITLASAVTVFALCDKHKSEDVIKLTLAVSAVTLVIAFLTIFAHEEDSIQSAYPQLYYTVQHLIAFWM